MFEQSLLVPPSGKKGWTFVASVAAEVTAVSVLLLIPLVYTEQLGNGWIQAKGLITPPTPPPPVHRFEATHTAPSHAAKPFVYTNLRLALNRPVLPDVAKVSFDEAPPSVCPACVPGAVDGPPSTYNYGANVTVPPPAPKPKPVEVKKPVEPPSGPIQVNKGVQEAKIIRRVLPVYPSLARSARVQGTVRLMGVINKEGRIEQLQVLSGHPLLVQAAVDAVKQWTYHPTLLSGVPVEVMAPIDVNFILN